MSDTPNSDFTPSRKRNPLARYEGLRFDHTRFVKDMTGREVLDEYLYLSSGFADMDEGKGSMGLPRQLEERKQVLEHALMVGHDRNPWPAVAHAQARGASVAG